MNQTGNSRFDQARVEWAIRLKYSPLPSLDMDLLATQLNNFRIGDMRQIGKTWEVMMERDGELAVNSDKRKSDLSALGWQIVSDGSPDGDRHAAALQYFYEHLNATEALEQDVAGGVDELIYQVGSALDYRYSIHEMLLRVDNAAAKEVTATFRHTPIWFFEARRGYLGYLKHIFDLYGTPCVQGEWLTAVNIGWMRPLCMAYAMKMFPLRDWLLFCTRYGSGFLEGITDAQPETEEWTAALESLQTLANDGAVLHNSGVSFKFLEQSARNALPFQPIVEMVNGLYAKCYRGVELATGSRGAVPSETSGTAGARSPVGASVQSSESGILQVRDCGWLTGTFNERIDRPVIRYLFNQEPRAWFVLAPPVEDQTADDLATLQGLVPMGFKVMLKEVYKRFRWQVPEKGEPVLEGPPPPPMPEAALSTEEDESDPANPPARPAEANEDDAPALMVDKPRPEDMPTTDALEDLDALIAPGALPATVQTASAKMPTPQGDSSWNLPAPSLAYALPNCRAAQALRRAEAAQRQQAVAKSLPNSTPPPAHALAAALAADLAPVRAALASIERISDPALQRAKLQEFIADHGPLTTLLKDINAYPKSAQVLTEAMARGFVRGLKKAQTK